MMVMMMMKMMMTMMICQGSCWAWPPRVLPKVVFWSSTFTIDGVVSAGIPLFDSINRHLRHAGAHSGSIPLTLKPQGDTPILKKPFPINTDPASFRLISNINKNSKVHKRLYLLGNVIPDHPSYGC